MKWFGRQYLGVSLGLALALLGGSMPAASGKSEFSFTKLDVITKEGKFLR